MSFAKRSSRPALLLLLPLLTALAWWAAWPRPPARDGWGNRPLLRATFLDVGQGDACVIESPAGRVVVVDGGGRPGASAWDGSEPGARVLVPFLRTRGISIVDLIVPTHPDDDHVQGLIAVVDRLRVRAALDGEMGRISGAYARLRERLRAHGVPILRARRGQVLDLGGGARLEVLHPRGRPLPGGDNENSVVLRLVYGRARMLFTGDAGAEAEADLLASGVDLSADLLKVGHHGSRGSSTEPFLQRVAPTSAVISCGRNNAFGHPHPQTLLRLARQGARVFRTDRDGAVTVETDGARIRITPTIAK